MLIDESKGAAGNPWGIRFQTVFHMSNDSGLFRTAAQLNTEGAQRDGPNWFDKSKSVWVPLYEGKMVQAFDHRAASVEVNAANLIRPGQPRPTTEVEHIDPHFSVEPQYWVKDSDVETHLSDYWNRPWMIAFKSVTSPTNERTFVASLVFHCGLSNSLIGLLPKSTDYMRCAALYGNINALVTDVVARNKVGGVNLNFFLVKQFCILPPDKYKSCDLEFIVPRVLELTYTANDIAPFASDLGYKGKPFAWNSDRRSIVRAELDAYYAKLYGLTRDELRYILDPADVYGDEYPSMTFPGLKRNEIRDFGEYRTRRLVLEAWDQYCEQ